MKNIPEAEAQNNIIMRQQSLNDVLARVIGGHKVEISAGPSPLDGSEDRMNRQQAVFWISLEENGSQTISTREQLAHAVTMLIELFSVSFKNADCATLKDQLLHLYGYPPREPLVLVIENTHFIQNDLVKKAIRTFMKYPPANMTVLLLRSDADHVSHGLPIAQEHILKEAWQFVLSGSYSALTNMFVSRGVCFYSPKLAEGLLKILDQIPQKHGDEYPILYLFKACMLYWSGQIGESHYVLHSAAEHMAGREPSDQNRWVLGEIYLMKGLLNMTLGEDDFTELLSMASALLPEGSRLLGEDSGFCIGNNYALIYPDYTEIDIFKALERMREVAPLMEKLTGKFGRGRAHLASAEVYYYTERIQQAKQEAQIAISKASAARQWDVVCRAHILLMRIAYMKGDYSRLAERLKQAKKCRLHCEQEQQALLHLPDIIEADLLIKIGEVHLIPPRFFEQPHIDTQQAVYPGGELLYQVAYYAERKQYIDALRLADRAQRLYTVEKKYFWLLSIYILKAIIYNRINEATMAMNSLQAAYEMSKANEISTIFAEYGESMVTLIKQIKQAKNNAIPVNWLEMISVKAKAYAHNTARIRRQFLSQQKHTSPLSSLTKREREMVNLLCEGFTNMEIASQMGIQHNSVRTSLSRIYVKIGADNRTDAVRMVLSEKMMEFSEQQTQ